MSSFDETIKSLTDQAQQLGAMKERQRIIKLLEADCCANWTVDCCDGACSAYKDAIKLIESLD